MGFHISWLAVHGKPADVVRAELGLIETGRRRSEPEGDVLGMGLPSGGCLLFFNRTGFPQRVDNAILALS